MSWLRFSFESHADAARDLAEFLERFGAQSVSLSAASNEALYAEGVADMDGLWKRTRVHALFPVDVDADILLACVRNHVGTETVLHHEIAPVPEQDWDAAAHGQAGPLMFDRRLCVCPGWCEPGRADHVLRMDPGLAFGSGRHPTTFLCLEWLAGAELEGATVIDYGCGSGILGIAAALMGARAVYAVDVDAQALTATAANAERNGVLERMHISAPGTMATASAHITLANILLNPLLQLAPRIAAFTACGGRVVLSGLLAHQADPVLEVYGRWFSMSSAVYREEWTLLEGRRTDAPVPPQDP